MNGRFLIGFISWILSHATKLGVVGGAVEAALLANRGQVSPEELLTYVGGPVAGGYVLTWLAPLIDKLKTFLPEPNQQRVAFIQSVVAMLEEQKSEGMPDELTVTVKRGEEVRSATWSKGMFKAVLLLGGCLFLSGCVPPLPDQPDKPDDKPVVKVDRAAICDELADMIPERIKTTDDLVRTFQILQDGGDWSQSDSVAVDAALPGLPTAKRALTKEDADKLRQVK